MKYFPLIWKNLWRKKARASLTILSVMVAFLLFALLSAIAYAFKAGEDVADAERLVIIDKVSLINMLPIAYQNRIASTPGVQSVTHATWFGGYYQELRNQFPQFPVDPYEYFSMYPELQIPEQQLAAWSKNRSGAVIGRELAEQFNIKLGDRIPIQATIWTRENGERSWEFDVEGIFSTDDPRGTSAYLLFHYDFFDEARQFAKGTVGWYVLRLEKGANPAEVATAIDKQFENSANESKTSTEAAFSQSFAKQFGNIGLIVQLILGAVFFTLLLVAGNTMSQSVRERISELAVLKTLGFTDRSVLGTVLAESILIMLLGGLLGLGLGSLLITIMAPTMGAFLPNLYLPPESSALAVVIMVAAGIAAGMFPALKAMRLSIVDALAHG